MSGPTPVASAQRRPAPAPDSRLHARIDALRAAAAAGEGRLDAGLLDDVRAGADRSAARLHLSDDHTVVAIAGATGSGKSTLFNALAGVELSASGARRPMTSTAQALVWGEDEPDELLTWLGIRHPDRHCRSGIGTEERRSRLPENLVLIDLPDHDSLAAAHHEEARRVVELADLLIWVVDPQKYADAAIHEEFLRPLAGHREVTMVVLNHIDTVPRESQRRMIGDLRKLLVADGIRDPRILATSARDGIGIADVREAITRRMREKQNAVLRIDADIRSGVARLEEAAGSAPASIPDAWAADLERRVAAGIDAASGRVSIDRPAIDNAVRGFIDNICRDLASGWALPLRTSVTRRLADTDDRLQAEVEALHATYGAPSRPSRWLRPVGLMASTVGALCVFLLVGMSASGRSPSVALLWAALALSAVLVVAGLFVRRLGQGEDVRSALDEQSRKIVRRVVHDHVVASAQRELASYARFVRALRTARG